MSSLTFTPAPGATKTWRRVLHQALIEATLVIRNGEQLLLALVIPVGLLVGGRFFGDRFGMPMSVLVPSVRARPMVHRIHLARDHHGLRTQIRGAGAASGNSAGQNGHPAR